MTVESTQNQATCEWWVTSHVRDQAQVGGYVPHRPFSGGGPVSVFWRGNLTRDWFRDEASRGEIVFRESLPYDSGEVATTIYAYGPTKEVVHVPLGMLGGYLSIGSSLAEFSAYRVEFKARSGTELSIWANVKEGDYQSLGQAGQNVGISVSAELFHRIAHELISRLVVETSRVTETEVNDLLITIDSKLNPLLAA